MDKAKFMSKFQSLTIIVVYSVKGYAFKQNSTIGYDKFAKLSLVEAYIIWWIKESDILS